MLPIQLSIVAANDLVRNGIQSIINQAAQSIQIENIFASLAECERQLKRQSVHILLLDDALPCNYKPFQLVNRLMNRYPLAKIVILSNCLNDYYVQGLIDAGARGFVYKDDHLAETLVSGIRTIADGHVYLSPQASGLPFRRFSNEILNATDIAVLQLLAEGETVQEISNRLGIVARTVYRVRGKLRDYLNVRTNEQIVDAAKQRGLILNDIDEVTTF